MKTLVTIMAHGDFEAQKTFDRHLNFWRAHGPPILVMCPEDSQVKTGLQMLTIGKKCHHGTAANARFRILLETLSLLDYDQHVIFEYDSICIVSEIPAGSKDGVYGMSFRDYRKHKDSGYPESPCQFQGSLFIHPPLVMNRKTVARVAEALKGVGDDSECGLWDRFLGLACQKSDIPVNCFCEAQVGYSENTIGRDHGLKKACEAAERGAVLFHGVKSKETLQAIVDARQFGIGRLNGRSEHHNVMA